ncbi:MAG: Ig-like domain-containing protein [Acidobacteria bacterium]|nr:Ig-like domain-containing protein [Acidobacteriota bacterium]
MTLRWRWAFSTVVLPMALVVALPVATSAQSVGQRASTTIAALGAYTSFFHSRPVLVRAWPDGDVEDVFLTDGEQRMRVLNVAPPPPSSDDRELLEVEATFWDVGRLPPDDVRVDTFLIRQLSERLFNRPWPVSGELMLLIADQATRAEEPEAATIQALSLEPTRYLDQTVTVIGRFRGRNLYGDLPEAPGSSPHDFVLQSGNAAVWVVGKEPRGRGFKLDVMARVDTGRWLEVTGLVQGDAQLLEIAATDLAPVERPATATQTQVVDDPSGPGPPPEVIFSAPTQDDTDVPTDALVRVQFSRDMDAESFEGHVDVAYQGTPGETDEDALAFTVAYRPRNRVLTVTMAEPLRPYATLTVSLGAGILAADGAAVVPYTLRFSTGGS